MASHGDNPTDGDAGVSIMAGETHVVNTMNDREPSSSDSQQQDDGKFQFAFLDAIQRYHEGGLDSPMSAEDAVEQAHGARNKKAFHRNQDSGQPDADGLDASSGSESDGGDASVYEDDVEDSAGDREQHSDNEGHEDSHQAISGRPPLASVGAVTAAGTGKRRPLPGVCPWHSDLARCSTKGPRAAPPIGSQKIPSELNSLYWFRFSACFRAVLNQITDEPFTQILATAASNQFGRSFTLSEEAFARLRPLLQSLKWSAPGASDGQLGDHIQMLMVATLTGATRCLEVATKTKDETERGQLLSLSKKWLQRAITTTSGYTISFPEKRALGVWALSSLAQSQATPLQHGGIAGSKMLEAALETLGVAHDKATGGGDDSRSAGKAFGGRPVPTWLAVVVEQHLAAVSFSLGRTTDALKRQVTLRHRLARPDEGEWTNVALELVLYLQGAVCHNTSVLLMAAGEPRKAAASSDEALLRMRNGDFVDGALRRLVLDANAHAHCAAKPSQCPFQPFMPQLMQLRQPIQADRQKGEQQQQHPVEPAPQRPRTLAHGRPQSAPPKRPMSATTAAQQQRQHRQRPLSGVRTAIERNRGVGLGGGPVTVVPGWSDDNDRGVHPNRARSPMPTPAQSTRRSQYSSRSRSRSPHGGSQFGGVFDGDGDDDSDDDFVDVDDDDDDDDDELERLGLDGDGVGGWSSPHKSVGAASGDELGHDSVGGNTSHRNTAGGVGTRRGGRIVSLPFHLPGAGPLAVDSVDIAGRHIYGVWMTFCPNVTALLTPPEPILSNRLEHVAALLRAGRHKDVIADVRTLWQEVCKQRPSSPSGSEGLSSAAKVRVIFCTNLWGLRCAVDGTLSHATVLLSLGLEFAKAAAKDSSRVHSATDLALWSADNLAYAHYRAGDFGESRRVLEKALRRRKARPSPVEFVALLHSVEVMTRQGLPQDALDLAVCLMDLIEILDVGAVANAGGGSDRSGGIARHDPTTAKDGSTMIEARSFLLHALAVAQAHNGDLGGAAERVVATEDALAPLSRLGPDGQPLTELAAPLMAAIKELQTASKGLRVALDFVSLHQAKAMHAARPGSSSRALKWQSVFGGGPQGDPLARPRSAYSRPSSAKPRPASAQPRKGATGDGLAKPLGRFRPASATVASRQSSVSTGVVRGKLRPRSAAAKTGMSSKDASARDGMDIVVSSSTAAKTTGPVRRRDRPVSAHVSVNKESTTVATSGDTNGDSFGGANANVSVGRIRPTSAPVRRRPLSSKSKGRSIEQQHQHQHQQVVEKKVPSDRSSNFGLESKITASMLRSDDHRKTVTRTPGTLHASNPKFDRVQAAASAKFGTSPSLGSQLHSVLASISANEVKESMASQNTSKRALHGDTSVGAGGAGALRAQAALPLWRIVG